jgi:AbrB family looped-hinge helix DNA binding protein
MSPTGGRGVRFSDVVKSWSRIRFEQACWLKLSGIASVRFLGKKVVFIGWKRSCIVLLEKRVFVARMTSKGQLVIPKAARGVYGFREGSTVRIIATEEGVVLKPVVEKPWAGLRGMMKKEWGSLDIDLLIEESKRSLLKKVEAE